MKETYGAEVGDKITCRFYDWEEDKNYKRTGIVYEVDHNDRFSPDVATFRFKDYKKRDCWFCGNPEIIVKAK